MTACIRLEQYILNLEYSYEQGDSLHCADWLDINIIAGMVELDEHYDYEILDMSPEECQAVQDRCGNEIQKKLLEGLRDESTSKK